jgi:hypothetical protein
MGSSSERGKRGNEKRERGCGCGGAAWGQLGGCKESSVWAALFCHCLLSVTC